MYFYILWLGPIQQSKYGVGTGYTGATSSQHRIEGIVDQFYHLWLG